MRVPRASAPASDPADASSVRVHVPIARAVGRSAPAEVDSRPVDRGKPRAAVGASTQDPARRAVGGVPHAPPEEPFKNGDVAHQIVESQRLGAHA